jgi:hypothetical protein
VPVGQLRAQPDRFAESRPAARGQPPSRELPRRRRRRRPARRDSAPASATGSRAWSAAPRPPAPGPARYARAFRRGVAADVGQMPGALAGRIDVVHRTRCLFR